MDMERLRLNLGKHQSKTPTTILAVEICQKYECHRLQPIVKDSAVAHR